MRRHFTFALAVLSLAVCLVSGQAQETTDRVLSFPATTTEIELQSYANVIQVIVGARPTADPAGMTRSLTVRGTADEIAFAEWLLLQINAAPASSQAAVSYDYKAAKDGSTAARMIYFPQVQSQQALTDTVNVMRAIGQVQRMISLPKQKAIALRGTPGQAELAEWLGQELEGSGAGNSQPSAIHQCLLEGRPMSLGAAVRVFRAGSGTDPRTLIELTNTVRTQTKANLIFPYPSRGAIVIRGSMDQLAQAEGIIQAAAR